MIVRKRNGRKVLLCKLVPCTLSMLLVLLAGCAYQQMEVGEQTSLDVYLSGRIKQYKIK